MFSWITRPIGQHGVGGASELSRSQPPEGAPRRLGLTSLKLHLDAEVVAPGRHVTTALTAARSPYLLVERGACARPRTFALLPLLTQRTRTVRSCGMFPNTAPGTLGHAGSGWENVSMLDQEPHRTCTGTRTASPQIAVRPPSPFLKSSRFFSSGREELYCERAPLSALS